MHENPAIFHCIYTLGTLRVGTLYTYSSTVGTGREGRAGYSIEQTLNLYLPTANQILFHQLALPEALIKTLYYIMQPCFLPMFFPLTAHCQLRRMLDWMSWMSWMCTS